MTIKSEMQGTRIEAELEAFYQAGKEGLTVSELSEIVGMGYYTVRKDILNLVKIGKIAFSGRIRDKAYIYCATGKSNVPTVLVNNENIEFTVVIDSAFQKLPTSPNGKILAFALVGIAARAKAGPGESVDFYPKTIKETLVDAVNRAENFVTAANSILEDPRYWNEYQLPDILDVDKYELDKLLALTRILMSDISGASNGKG